ncbi:hypothetical protein EBZ70_12610 [bacterium]|nr:hypothetical protein [bacterium]
MHKQVKQAGRAIKRAGHPLKIAGVMSLGLVLLAVLETYAAYGAFRNAVQADLIATPWGELPKSALFHSAKSVICGLLAFVGSAIAGSLRDDPRKEVSSRAWQARAVAFALLVIPVGNLASTFAFDREAKAWETYQGSDAYEADKTLANDPQADSRERRDAAERLTPPGKSQPDFPDWAQAIFLHLLVMWSASAFRAPRPLTEAQRAALEKQEARKASAAKARATRERNAKAKAAAAKPGNVFDLRKRVSQ